ncbi:MAG: hypothetical protein JSV01_10560 [Desulfobacterales bacterium]|nr:MAG: hypothetical protein JSV01_10560 [Desulfobacterales bacterium]
MSKRKSKKKQPPRESSPSKRRRGLKISVGVAALAAVAVVAVVLHVGRDKAHEEKKETATPAESAEVEESKGNLQALIGRWLRVDGGYIIEIRSISANGRLDAGYLNPRPINVSRAEASRRGDEVRVFMELQDVGYPGSTYTLTYDPQRDLLRGVYFHAGLSQTFDVVFIRTE